MSSIDTQALRDAQRTPFAPKATTTLYLYDQADPRIVSLDDQADHVTVEVDCGGSGVRIAAWTPATLRRLADVCAEAADELEQARERAVEAEQVPA